MESNTEKSYPSSSYLVAYEDIEFLNRDDLRPVRLQLELLKPELIMKEHKIVSTVTKALAIQALCKIHLLSPNKKIPESEQNSTRPIECCIEGG